MGLFPVTCTEREEPEFKKLILESVFTQDTAYTVNIAPIMTLDSYFNSYVTQNST